MAADDAEPEPQADIEVLRSACTEARMVLDHQLAVLGEIDDKAIWSVRTAVIVLGLVISAGSLADGTSIRSLPSTVFGVAATGTFALAFTIWFGMVTYHWSFEEDGIATHEVDQALSNATTEREWRAGLLRTGYVIWIDQQESFNEYNQQMLLITHLALSLGVTLLLTAGALYLIGV